MTAGVSALQSFTKFKAAKNQEGLAENSLNAATQLASGNQPGIRVGDLSYRSSGGQNGSAGGDSQNVASASKTSEAKDPIESSCSNAEGNSSAELHIACAVGSDSKMGFVANSEFKNAFEKATGQNLGEFLANADEPHSALMTSMGANLTGTGKSELAGVLAAIDRSLPFDTGAIARSGRGGGAGSSGDSAPPDMAAMMAGIMGQFMPKEGSDEPPAGFTVMDFRSLTRSPAAVAEDRSINIFQRISFRYHYVGRRVFSGGANK